MAEFAPKLEAWTRFAESALSGILASVEEALPPKVAVKLAADYADEMTLAWQKKREKLAEEDLSR